MRLDPLARLALRSLLWLGPALALWWWTLQPLLLPALQGVVGPAVNMWYVQEQARLHRQDGEWHVSTRMLMEPAGPDSKKLRVWNFKVPLVEQHTGGFPLLWALLLSLPAWKLPLRLLLGSAALFALTGFTLWLQIVLFIAELPAGAATYQVLLVSNQLQSFNAAPVWLLELLRAGLSALSYFVVLVAPPLLAFFLHRRQLLPLLPAAFRHAPPPRPPVAG